MTINEDYLDDIEMNVSDDSKSDIDAAASEDAAALDLTFDALVNIKNYMDLNTLLKRIVKIQVG